MDVFTLLNMSVLLCGVCPERRKASLRTMQLIYVGVYECYRMSVTLFEHQRVACETLKYYDQYALFCDGGVGKTLIILTHILHLIRNEGVENVLVIAPRTGLAPYERDIEKMDRADADLLRWHVHFVSIDSTWTNKAGDSNGHKKIRPRDGLANDWDVVIVDESHKIKNWSNRTKAVISIGDRAKYRYIMTGTPYSGGHYINIYYQFRFLNDRLFETKKKFVKRFVREADYFGNPIRYDVDGIMSVVKDNAIVLRKEDCLDLPAVLPNVINRVDLADKAIFKKVVAGDTDDLNIDITSSGTKWNKLCQICSGSLKDDLGQTTTLKCNKDEYLADQLEGMDGKMVVFCHYKASIQRVADICKRGGHSYMIYDMGAPDDLWRTYQKDDTKVFIAQYQRGASIDLFAASVMVFFEPTTSADLYEQARWRIDRTGQTEPCEFIHYVTRGTVEEKILESVLDGKSVSDKQAEQWAAELGYRFK